ncbi:MAG: DNA recombinase [Parasporobacterium sp.]|nr:DNA recombinase [Parasporobacterium sp.]
MVTAVNDAWSRKDNVLQVLKENIRAVLDGDVNKKVVAVDKAIRDKQTELLEAGNDQNLIDRIGDEIMRLREERQSILTEAALKHDLQDRIEDLITFLDEQTDAITEYSEPLARRLIEKITVYDEKLVVEFKSDLQIDVEV